MRVNKHKNEVGQVISTNHEPLELEWLTGCYSGTQEREGDIMVCVINVMLYEKIGREMIPWKESVPLSAVNL